MAVVRSMVLAFGDWAPADERYRRVPERRINPQRVFIAAEFLLRNRRE
jgi:hypothetical protein